MPKDWREPFSPERRTEIAASADASLRKLKSTCPACPRCKRTATVPTLPTTKGSYCRCQDCGHVWYADETEHS